jgi:integration host factor subunit beta
VVSPSCDDDPSPWKASFKVRERRARRARNPRSGGEVMVPAKLVPLFKPSKELKAQVLGSTPQEETVVK